MSSYYDIAQICGNGHVVTMNYNDRPVHRQCVAAALGWNIVCTGETPLPGRPDYAVHLNKLLAGYVDLKVPDDIWKMRLIEEDFHRLMFDTEGA